jgi:hypothetical protein
LVSGIPAGDGKNENLFLQCSLRKNEKVEKAGGCEALGKHCPLTNWTAGEANIFLNLFPSKNPFEAVSAFQKFACFVSFYFIRTLLILFLLCPSHKKVLYFVPY